jgi:hypothetical protein
VNIREDGLVEWTEPARPYVDQRERHRRRGARYTIKDGVVPQTASLWHGKENAIFPSTPKDTHAYTRSQKNLDKTDICLFFYL